MASALAACHCHCLLTNCNAYPAPNSNLARIRLPARSIAASIARSIAMVGMAAAFVNLIFIIFDLILLFILIFNYQLLPLPTN